MRTEDLFRYGVTPKEGKNAGRRYRVVSINEKGLVLREWDNETFGPDLKHGEYQLWEPEHTLFDSGDIAPTWGNLKKAMEAAKVSDDTEFVVMPDDFGLFGICEPAHFSVRTLRVVYEKPKKCILVQ